MELLIEKTSQMLDTIERWENYCELTNLKKSIINKWTVSIHKRIMAYFEDSDNQMDGWSFDFTKSGGSPHFRWIPNNCDTIFTLNLYQFKDFNLWLHAEKVESVIVKEKIKSDQFKSLISYHRNDDDTHAWFVFQEKGNFDFEGADCNGNLSYRHMLWYANFQFDDYIKQLKEKLDLICTKENSLLFQKLYQEVKR